jgi:Hexameric tyrosine-coordinated heme protein (HTHP)
MEHISEHIALNGRNRFGSSTRERITRRRYVTEVPKTPLVPDNSLITSTPEAGRALAITLARHSIHAIQNNLETLQEGRAHYAHEPLSLIASSQVIAIEFATVAAANNYWRA